MSKKEKALQKLRLNPQNVRPEELAKILLWYGFSKRAGKGSHTVFQLGEYRVTVPHQVPFLKAIYVKLALEILDQLEVDEDGDETIK